MTDRFIDQPILNSPYEYPRQHWVLELPGQPTGEIGDGRRWEEFMTSGARSQWRRAGPVKAEFAADRTRSTGVQRSGLPLVSVDDFRERSEVWRVRFRVDPTRAHTGEIRSDGPDGIACWFIHTDYNEESFFVRHAYFFDEAWSLSTATARGGSTGRGRGGLR